MSGRSGGNLTCSRPGARSSPASMAPMRRFRIVNGALGGWLHTYGHGTGSGPLRTVCPSPVRIGLVAGNRHRGSRPRCGNSGAGAGRRARRRRARDQGNPRPRHPGIPLRHHSEQGRTRADQGPQGPRGHRAALRQSVRPLFLSRAGADRAAAGRLAGAQQGHAVRTAAPAGSGRETGSLRHRAAARDPEGRDPGGPGPRHQRARDHSVLSGPGRAHHRTANEGPSPGRPAQPRQGGVCRGRRASGERSGPRLPARRGRRSLDRPGPHLERKGQPPVRPGRRRANRADRAGHGAAGARTAPDRDSRLARGSGRPAGRRSGPWRAAGRHDPGRRRRRSRDAHSHGPQVRAHHAAAGWPASASRTAAWPSPSACCGN